MKQMRGIPLYRFFYFLLIFSFLTCAPSFAAKPDQPVLARVDVEGVVDDLTLPVFAHLVDGTGADYALVIATQKQLNQAGVQYSILDKTAAGADYFILSMFPVNKPVPVGLVENALLNDGRQVIVRSTFKQVETYGDAGLDVQWLGRKPMVLGVDAQRPPLASAMALTYDATIAQIINQVNQTTLETYTRNLSGEDPVDIGGSPYTIVSRHTASGTPIDKATQYVYEFMQTQGLTVSYHNWSAGGYSGRNVIGQMTGTTQPNEIVLIIAHLDCMPSGSISYGADDNASGSVAVMVSAELMSNYQFNRTVRFAVFTGEEQGILGANEYSDMIYANGDNVVAVYNMDMLAYDAVGGPDLRIHTRTSGSSGYAGDMEIANTFVDVVNTYSLSSVLTPIIDSDGITASDHSAFWNNGWPAILGIEEHDNDMTPYYHTTSDRVSTLNWTYFTNFAKASVGTAAHLAFLDDGTILADFSATPTTGSVPMAVTFTDLSIGATSWSWDFGDTGTSTDRNPIHTYTAAGIYTVVLTATGPAGTDVMTKTGYITVTPPQPPVAEFTAGNTNPYVGNNVTFTDLSTNNPTTWSWTFEGGTPGTSTDQDPVVTYNTVGTYTVTLLASNTAGSDTETKTGYIIVTDAPLVYCSSQGNNYSYEYIGNVTVGDLDYTSAGSNYTDYFATLSAHVNAGDNVSVSLTPVFPSSTYSEYWKIWIDYNIDGDFDDAGEEVFSDSGTTAVSGNFTVPAGASGTTRMRVSMKWNAAPTPCEAFSYGEVEDYAIVITPVTVDPPAAEFTASATTITAGQSVTFTDTSTNTPTSWSWTFEGGTPATSTQQNPTVTFNTDGVFDVSLTATNAGGSDDEVKLDYITVDPVSSGIVFEKGTVSGVGSSWQTVTLTNTYTSPVVVCTTGIANSSATPAVVRVRNAAGSSFDVMVQNPSGTALSGHTVHYMVVEEGVYTSASDGVTMEAVKVTSTATAENSSWVLEAQSYQNSYSSPVVVGQVMTYNDPGWSVFWASGSSRLSPPTGSAFYAGKHVGEDSDVTRANETIGYIVIEAGSGTINGVSYTAALGTDMVRGPDNTSSGYTYTFGSVANVSTAILSAAAMDGGNGGWPVMYGSTPLTNTSLTLVFDEDQIYDSERKHGTEQVAYIVFGQ